MTVNAQKAAPEKRFPEIDSIETIEDVKQWMRAYRYESEQAYRGMWRDQNNVMKTELPALDSAISAVDTAVSAVGDFDIPLIKDIVFSFAEIEGERSIVWTAGTVRYAGTDYTVSASESSAVKESTSVYIDLSSLSEPTVLGVYTNNEYIDPIKWTLATRIGVNVYTVLQSPIIHGGFIQANSIQTAQLHTNAVTTSVMNFTPLISGGGTGAIIATINASVEGGEALLSIDSSRINVTGSTTFAAGYDPSTKLLAVAGNYKTAAASARVELFPDTDTGIVAYNAAGAKVFEVLVGGDGTGDVTIGDYDSDTGMKWDQSASTFDIRGSITAGDISTGTLNVARIGTGAIEQTKLGTTMDMFAANSAYAGGFGYYTHTGGTLYDTGSAFGSFYWVSVTSTTVNITHDSIVLVISTCHCKKTNNGSQRIGFMHTYHSEPLHDVEDAHDESQLGTFISYDATQSGGARSLWQQTTIDIFRVQATGNHTFKLWGGQDDYSELQTAATKITALVLPDGTVT